MVHIIIWTIIFGAVAKNVMHEFNLSRLMVCFIFLVLGVVLYFTNVILIQKYIQKNAKGLPSELWEETAGTGIVPKWVSSLGLMSISAFITAILPWIIAIFK